MAKTANPHIAAAAEMTDVQLIDALGAARELEAEAKRQVDAYKARIKALGLINGMIGDGYSLEVTEGHQLRVDLASIEAEMGAAFMERHRKMTGSLTITAKALPAAAKIRLAA